MLEAKGPLFWEHLGPRTLHGVKIHGFLSIFLIFLIFSHDTCWVFMQYRLAIMGKEVLKLCEAFQKIKHS